MGLNQQKQKMTPKPETISVRSKVISFIENQKTIPSIWKIKSTKKPSKTRGKVWSPHGGGNALQKMGAKNRLKLRETAIESVESNTIQKTACMHRGSSWIDERAFGTHSTEEIMKITLQEKGYNFQSHHNLVHKFIPLLQAMKIPVCERSSGQRMGEARRVARVAMN